MKIPIARTPDGTEILLTDEHQVCMAHKMPVVAVGHDFETAEVRGKLDRIQTDKGLYDAARLVIEWMETGPEKSTTVRAMAFRYLKDGPEYL